MTEWLLLQRMQVRQQALQILGAERLAVAWHFVAAVANDFAHAIVVCRQPAYRKIRMLKNSLQPRSLSPLRRIGPMAAVAVAVLGLSPGSLLRVEAELGV